MPVREGDIPHSQASIVKAKSLLNYEPSHNFKEGIEASIEWYFNNLSMNYNIAVIGLGYVGLPLANALAKNFNIIGYDINQDRIMELNNGKDSTKELSSEQVKEYLNKEFDLY